MKSKTSSTLNVPTVKGQKNLLTATQKKSINCTSPNSHMPKPQSDSSKLNTNIRSNNRNKTQLCAPAPYSPRVTNPKHVKDTDDIQFSDSDSFTPTTTNEAYQKCNNPNTINTLLHAKETILNLKHEAKLCMESSKRMIKETQNSRRMSFVSEEIKSVCSSSAQKNNYDMMKDLSESISQLQQRIAKNELLNQEQFKEGYSIKNAIKSLERKIEEHKNEKITTNAGCGIECCVM